MRWFKHYTDASNNDKIGLLEAKFGILGYGVYFKILEICGSNWDEISEPEFTFSFKKLQSFIDVKPKTLKNALQHCNELGLFSYKEEEKIVTIRFDKLSEIKKRYQKNDVATTNKKPSNSTPNKIKRKKEEEEADVFVATAAPPEHETTQVVKIETLPVTTQSDRIKKSEKVWLTIQVAYGYPREIFDEIEKDAWLIFEASDDPKKEWGRFLSHYLKNEKEKIKDRLVDLHDKQEQKKLLMELGGFNV